MSDDARQRAVYNKRLPCSVKLCPKKRTFTAQFCCTHQLRRRLHGHHLGRHIQKKEYTPYLKTVRAFLTKHQHHAAVKAALEIMASLLAPPKEEPQGKPLRLNPSWQLWRELWRLKQEGVTPQEALEVVLAVWLYSYHFPHQLRDDKRLDYALAASVFRLRELASRKQWVQNNLRPSGFVQTTSRRPGALPNALLGGRIRTALVPFWINFIKALEAEHAARAKKAADLKAAF